MCPKVPLVPQSVTCAAPATIPESGFTLAGTDGIGRNANRYAVAYTIRNNRSRLYR